jgi:hypothetical protein
MEDIFYRKAKLSGFGRVLGGNRGEFALIKK